MNDNEGRWLVDDLFVINALFLVAASLLAIALTSCLWHHIHPEPPTDNAILAALASFRIPTARTVPTLQQQPLAVTPSDLVPEQKDHKGTRSKERRRRGKDPFRELLKGGKKSKALLRAITAADHEPVVHSADTLSVSNDTASSTSRSQSLERAGTLDRRSRLDGESDDGGETPDASVVSSVDTSDQHSSDACPGLDLIRPRSAPPESVASADTQLNVSAASTVSDHASEAPSSPPVCADVYTPQPSDSQATSTSGNCAKLVRARTMLRIARKESSNRSSLSSFSPSPLPDSMANPLPAIRSPSLSTISPINHSTDGAGPSTPTNSRGSTPPRSEGLDHSYTSDQGAASAQMRLAAMQGALEASCLREEQLRIAADQASKECDELRWRWNEDTSQWRRREAELQTQIHHLMQQLQTYVAVASFQAQRASTSGFSSPTSPHTHPSPHLPHHPLVPFPLPPPIQTQNSASPPAHVQALLASAPMLSSHPPGFAVPAPTGVYSGAEFGMSPLIWSGMGLCVPKLDPRHGGRRTPDSSASGSSSRGRRRRRHVENVRSASDESSLGDWDGAEDGSGDEDPWVDEEDEDIFRNNALADAILKRPESIRELGKRSGVGRVSAVHTNGERMDALKDPAEHGPLGDIAAVRTATNGFNG